MIAGMILLVGLCVLAWARPDPLPLVPHVEGILALAAKAHWALEAAGVASLILLPIPFLAVLGARELHSEWDSALALFIYIASTVIVPFIRCQPFPLLGWGASPVIGYALAIVSLCTNDLPIAGGYH